MHRLLLVFGGTLNLVVLFGPIGWRYGLTPWQNWELAVVACAVTLFFLADSDHSERFAPRCRTPHDYRAIQLAYLTGIGLLLTLWGSLVEYAERARPAPIWQIWLGGLLMLVGAMLRRSSVRTLGREFVTEITPQVDHSFVETGIYAYLRHPSETAILTMIAGATLTLGSRFGFAALALVLFPLAVFRVRLEDEQLAKTYGDRHAAYVRRVGTFVPQPWFVGRNKRSEVPAMRINEDLN